MRNVHAALSVAVALAACAAPDARSPTLDYPAPPPQTADGEVVGADRVSPGDKLDTGPKVGVPGGPAAGRPSGEPRGAPPSRAAPDDPRCKLPGPIDPALGCPPPAR